MPFSERRFVHDDGHRREDDYDVHGANAWRGGGSKRGEGASRAGYESPRPSTFEAVVTTGSIACDCGTCERFQEHVLREGQRKNPTIEPAKRDLVEQLLARAAAPATSSTATTEARLRGERDKMRAERDEACTQRDLARARVNDLAAEADDLHRDLKDGRDEIRRLRDDLAMARVPPPQTSMSRGQSRGGRYRHEPSWDSSHRHREGSPARKRGISDAAEREQPPRQLARSERYDGSRWEAQDDCGERSASRGAQGKSSSGDASSSIVTVTESKGKGRATTPAPTLSTSTSTSAPAGPLASTGDPYLDDTSDYGSDLSNASDEPRMTTKQRMDVDQGKAERGYAVPLCIDPQSPCDPEVRAFLTDRMRHIEDPDPSQHDSLMARTRNAAHTRKSSRTPYQRAVAPFVSLPLVQSVIRPDIRRPPEHGDSLAHWLLYALNAPTVMPRGIQVVSVPRARNVRAVPTSQVRTRMTLSRVLPAHNDMQSSFAAVDPFNFYTSLAIAIVDIVISSPPLLRSYGSGYAAWLRSIGATEPLPPRALRRWDLSRDHTIIDAHTVTKFFHSVGISVAEFNDMLPFVAQLLWDNVVHGIDNGFSSAAYCRLRDHIIRQRGVWPAGLPGPTHLVNSGDVNPRLLFAQPQLPGEGQPFLVFTESPAGKSTIIADPNYYGVCSLSLETARKAGFPDGIRTTPWPASAAGPSTNADAPPLAHEDAVMVDAPTATATTSTTSAPHPRG
ncbi:hypothetical protein GGG16DRAFT_60228 [Schizophyllum commune]